MTYLLIVTVSQGNNIKYIKFTPLAQTFRKIGDIKAKQFHDEEEKKFIRMQERKCYCALIS